VSQPLADSPWNRNQLRLNEFATRKTSALIRIELAVLTSWSPRRLSNKPRAADRQFVRTSCLKQVGRSCIRPNPASRRDRSSQICTVQRFPRHNCGSTQLYLSLSSVKPLTSLHCRWGWSTFPVPADRPTTPRVMFFPKSVLFASALQCRSTTIENSRVIMRFRTLSVSRERSACPVCPECRPLWPARKLNVSPFKVQVCFSGQQD